MDNIKDILNNIVGDIAAKNPNIQSKVDDIWKNVLEEQDLKHTKLLDLKDGVLYIVVDSPAWLYQIQIKKRKILKRMQDEIPEIKRIQLKVGKI